MVVAKVFGVIFLLAGILCLLGGVAAALNGYMEEEDNQENGLLANPERSDTNQQMMEYGALAAGVGLLLTILGAVLVSVGPKVVVAGTQAPSEATASAGSRGSAALRIVKKNSENSAPQPKSSKGRNIAIGLILAGLLIVLMLVLIPGAPGGGRLAGTMGLDTNGSPVLGTDSFEGTIEQGVSLVVAGSATDGDNDHDVRVPAGATRLEAIVEWDEAMGGARELELMLTNSDGRELGRFGGETGFMVDYTGDDLSMMGLHYQVFPAGDAAVVAEQAFTITTTFHRGP